MSRGEPDEWLQEWAEHLIAEAYSPRTIHHRVNTMRCIAQASGTCPLELTKAHVVAYLTAGDYAPRTRENYLATVRMFCRWAGMEDLTAEVRRPRIPRSVPKPVSEAGLARLLMTAGPGSREYAWIVLGAYAGLRSAESAAVRAGDLEESGQGWALRVKGKGGVERLVPVPPVVVRVMRGWTDRIAGRGRLWPGATARAVQNAIRAVAVRAEVACSSHQLRHRYGTAVYRASRDLLLTQRLMGHASPSHTAGYAAVVLEEAADVILRLPGADSVAFASGLLSGAAAVGAVHAGARA